MSQFRSEFWLQPNEPTWKEEKKKNNSSGEEKKNPNTSISVNL